MKSFFPEIYSSWKQKQERKYLELLPALEKHLKQNSSVLDLGIGKAWFEEFLLAQGFRFKKIIGADVSKKAIEPRRDFAEYKIAKNFSSKEKFDFVVCFDALHLLKNKKVQKFAAPGGLVLVSVPKSKNSLLKEFEKEKVLARGTIGVEEKDAFVLLRR